MAVADTYPDIDLFIATARKDLHALVASTEHIRR
jgi:hypothetical protein